MDWVRRMDLPAHYVRWAPRWLTSVLVGLAACALALLLRALLRPVWPAVFPFGLLFPAMLLATLFGRWLAGLACMVAGGLVTWLWILPPSHLTGAGGDEALASLLMYALVGILILGTAEAYRQSERKLLREQARRSAAESRRQRMLAQELGHRIKNTLATVQAIAAQTFGRLENAAESRNAFDGRLAALGRAHDLLTRTAWDATTLEQLLATALAPFDDGARFRLSGPALALPSRQAIALALGVHELATNALKHGALSVPGGSVDILWTVGEGRFRLAWIERGGPAPVRQGPRGFGSRLLERGLAAELEGSVRLEFPPEGARCAIEAPVAAGLDVRSGGQSSHSGAETNRNVERRLYTPLARRLDAQG